MNTEKVRPPFSAYEKEYLRELVLPNIQVLESKKTNSCFNKQKNEVWEKITEKFNNCSRCTHASAKQLKKAWNNMKSRARDAKSVEMQRHHTGGGPPIKDMDEEDEAVLSIIPNILPQVRVVHDSDGPGFDMINADDDTIFWTREVNRDFTSPPLLIRSESPAYTTTRKSRNSRSPTPIISSTPHPSTISPLAVASTSATKYKNPNKIKNNNQDSIDTLKKKIILNDADFRLYKHNMEMEHLKIMQQLERKIMETELEYKKRLLEMAEEEHKLKMQKYSTELCVPDATAP